jgi:dihydroxy-acid dehydratase
MKRKLRSNFERGSSLWAVRRAQWKALGISDEDMEKPKIAIVNSSSELAICFSHLDGVAEEMKKAIRAAGGLPFEVRTAAPADFITSAGGRGRYILPSRDLIANDIEVAVEGAQLDGMVLLASCDKTTPGQIMAAGRLNIPSIVAICGYQGSGEYKGHHVDIEDVFLTAGHVLAGKTPIEELEAMADVAISTPGVCAGMGTANSMHIVTEALGMALPGSAPVRANSEKMFEMVRRTGERIVQMVWDDLKPRDILSPGSFANAVAAVLSVAGSINCTKHLQAIAEESDVDVDVYKLLEELADKVPVLTAVRPIGNVSTEEFEDAGGAQGIMKNLEPILRGEAMTVTGAGVAENLKGLMGPDGDAIRPFDRPYSSKPPIVLVRGSLCPDGGLVKLGLVEGRVLQFTGTAHVFERPEHALDAVRDRGVHAGEVVVLRNLGVKGAPGMGMASRVVFALDGAGLGADVAVVTDGQLSGLVNKGLVIGEVTPETAEGGPLALVKDGDEIAIDIENRTCDLNVPPEELEKRRSQLGELLPKDDRGWLSIYQRTVRPLAKGATLLREG